MDCLPSTTCCCSSTNSVRRTAFEPVRQEILYQLPAYEAKGRMAQCSIERTEGNRQAVHRMPRKIEGGSSQDCKGACSLFMTAEGALHWAYAVSSMPIVHMSAINSMRM